MVEIPDAIEELYHFWVTDPNPERWPEHLRHGPAKGHGLYSFYQGLTLGL